jgi:hypothetical protein
MLTFSFRYSRSFLRRLYLRELWRTQAGWLFIVPLAVVLGLWALSDADRWVLAAFFIGLTTAYLLLLTQSFRRQSAELVDQVVTVTADEHVLEWEVDSVKSTVPWRAIRSIRETSDAMILELRGRSGPITVPFQGTPSEFVTFAKDRLRERVESSA